MSTKRITADIIRTVTSTNGTDHKAIRSTDVQVSITKGNNYPANTTKIAIESRYGIQPREAALLNITFADGTLWSGNVTELQATLLRKERKPLPAWCDKQLIKAYNEGQFDCEELFCCGYTLEFNAHTIDWELSISKQDDLINTYLYIEKNDALADVSALQEAGVKIEEA